MDKTPSNETEEPPEQQESAYDIGVSVEAPADGMDSRMVVSAIRATLDAHRRTACKLSVALVNDATMAELHERYMGISGPTDVLTFDLDENDPDTIDGEIVISVDTAARESDKRRHTLTAEILLYAIHGTLHLLGYDDRSEAEAQKMHAREDELLAAMGVGPVYGRATP